MRAYGAKQTKTRVAGHQNCTVCHSDNKVSPARERQASQTECTKAVAESEALNECDAFYPCDMCRNLYVRDQARNTFVGFCDVNEDGEHRAWRDNGDFTFCRCGEYI